MADPIPPALTPEEWKEWLDPEWTQTRSNAYIGDSTYGPAALIAVANAALPPDDPRKLTRERISDLKDVAMLARDALKVYGYDESKWGNVPRTLSAMIDRVEAHAFALESLLPPE